MGVNYMAIVGYPLKHTLSPDIYNAVFRKNNIDIEYTVIEIKPDEFDSTVSRLIGDRYCKGFNVTIPYKERIRMLVQETNFARDIGAVNVFINSKGIGDNTDWIGFLKTLPVGFRPQAATVIGAGGAARAVVYALLKMRLKRLFIINRTSYRAERLKERFSRLFPSAHVGVCTFADIGKAIFTSDIVVNATPVGMYPKMKEVLPIDFDAFSDGKIAYDLVYNPGRTAFLNEAEVRGAKAINGMNMLLSQAYYNLHLWGFGKIAVDVFKEGRKIVEDAIWR